MSSNQLISTRTIDNKVFIPLIKEYIDKGKIATFRVKGYSMRPFLDNDRDCVEIAPLHGRKIKVGDVVLAEVSKQRYVLHRVFRITKNGIILRGDGNTFGTESCQIDNIIGFARAFLPNGLPEKRIDTDSFIWQAYSKIWPQNSFLRRCLLYVFRKTIFRNSP